MVALRTRTNHTPSMHGNSTDCSVSGVQKRTNTSLPMVVTVSDARLGMYPTTKVNSQVNVTQKALHEESNQSRCQGRGLSGRQHNVDITRNEIT